MSEKQVWEIIKDFNCADLNIVLEPAIAVWNSQQVPIDKLQKRVNQASQMLQDWSDQTYRDDAEQLIGELRDVLRGEHE
ncbi:hypothetical protein QR674_07755 [Acinetobacter chinensis]|uniref:Uncharacterized protein n=1 Tax=Acinetobacter chinensis TaxID=2004650 RepID=A0ABU3WEY6_9GAMM|nr:hypothetical protein [Acinetobacter chinensis]MDV2468877.1 hypothetical protein [Acinetobacter chinensis]